MKKLQSLAAYALIAPAITLGAGTAIAADPPGGRQGEVEQRTTYEQSTTTEEHTTQGQRQMPTQSEKAKGMATADRAQEQRMATDRARQQRAIHGTYLSSAPVDSFRSADLLGAKLNSRADNETIGEISDLVIDKDGQIAAVIVEAGGFLGLGKKEVAVSWDSIERRLNDKGDGYYLSIDTTKDALTNAPEYKSEARKY